MNVSNAVKSAYKNGSHAKVLNISFPDINYTVPTDEVYYESMTLDEAIFDSDSFEAVGCIASQFVVSIRDTGENLKGQKIVVTISLADVQDSTIPLFYGYVDTVDREAQKKMQKITAYDALYSIGNTEVASWYNALTFPITLGDLRNSLFTYIGLPHETVTLPNDSITINKEYNPNTMKAINVIKSLCQINGCFGMMNRTGTFEYRYLDTDGTSEAVSFYRDIDYKDYVVNPVDRLTIRQSTDDVGVTIGSGDNQYIIQGNMFTYNLESTVIYNIATNIYSYLNDIEYIPFEAKNNGYPWIEVGDNCVLDYSVYDFDNSTSSQDVYKDVTVVAMKRSMSGIQNLIDSYTAEGKELQKEFISDISVELDVLQQTVEELVKNLSTEITTYRNPSVITIADGGTATIADMVYEASKGNTVIFHEEADFDVVATETYSNEVYTEGDVVGTVRYYVDGYRLPTHLSEEVFREGKHILNLTQFWQAGEKDRSRVQAKLTVNGGSVTLQRFRAQAYITVKQSDYNDASIEVTQMPDKLVYHLGEHLDFTGLIVSKVYYDESIPSENITALCTFSPAEGSTVTSTDLIDVLVTYTETNELGEITTYETSFQLSTQYLISISVEQEPDDMEYMVGESLDLTGIKVVADYADGTTADVTSSCVFSPADGYTFISDSEGEIQISYTEDGITCTTSIYVLVESVPVFTGISIVTPPNKTSYYYGELSDYTGIVVHGLWSDGTEEDITADCTFNPVNNSTITEYSTNTVVVSYVNDGTTYTDSFELTILTSTPFLEYFEYSMNTPSRYILLKKLRGDLVVADNVQNLIVPHTYTDPDSGIEYTVYLA